MTMHAGLLDELERDLGVPARQKVLDKAGGQRRYVPVPNNAGSSSLADELGSDIALWLAGRYGGDVVTFPSRFGAQAEDRSSKLRAAILDAGLTKPSRSANDIAQEFGVSEDWVLKLRREMRGTPLTRVKPRKTLPLFPDLPE